MRRRRRICTCISCVRAKLPAADFPRTGSFCESVVLTTYLQQKTGLSYIQTIKVRKKITAGYRRSGILKGEGIMAYLKNIGQSQVLRLADEVAVAPGQVVSKTLAQNDAVSITLFAFSKGEEISTHSSEGDAMVLVLDGCGELTVGGVKHVCKAGESIVMPANVPHAVYAKEDFKMLLTVVFPL
jgi:quercetin dioxygenase-like cupin family protein